MPIGGRDTLTATEQGEVVLVESGLRYRHGMILEKANQASAGAEKILKNKLPPNAFIEYIELKNDGAITFVTGDSIGVGTVADPDAITEFDSYTTTDGSQVDVFLGQPTRLSRTAESDIVLTSTNGSGAEAGTWAGVIDVLIFFKQIRGIDQNEAF